MWGKNPAFYCPIQMRVGQDILPSSEQKELSKCQCSFLSEEEGILIWGIQMQLYVSHVRWENQSTYNTCCNTFLL